MPETKKKAKKIRLYKYAAEYNLSTDSIVKYLEQKGYKIKSHMSALDEDMISAIREHFKKDIEKAENHYRKIDEFQRRMAEKTDRDERVASIEEEEEEAVEVAPEDVEAPDEVAETEIEKEPAETEAAEEVGPEASDDAADASEVVAEAGDDAADASDDAATDRPPAEVILEEATAEGSEEKEPAKAAKEKADADVADVEKPEPKADEPKVAAKKKAADEPKEGEPKESKGRQPKFKTHSPNATAKGLTVLGKMDLDAEKKKAAKKKVEDPKGKEKEDDKKKRRKLKRKKPDDTAAGKRRRKKVVVSEEEVKRQIRRTMSTMDDSGGSSQRAASRKKKRREKQEQEEIQQEIRQREEATQIAVTEYISVSELANLMNVPVTEVIAKCVQLGLMVSINQRLEKDTIELVADEFNFKVVFEEEYTSDEMEDFEDPEESLKPRPPVVTIMGHVDHGKTSLLDYIREANVVAGESGGITQHIGAYQVKLDEGKLISFLDTPGHEAFTAMRARGAQITDIVVLIVAADDAVMPQTVEAINHAQAAGVPIIVAINKIDKPTANVDKIKQQLADRNVLVEDWGGKYQTVEVSAKTGLNVDQLLEKIHLESEMLELKANPDRNARGVVVEAELDKGRGVTATVLVRKGTLKIGDPFVAGNHYGRVRAMFDERNNKLEEAKPAQPALILGLDGAPQAGDELVALDSERQAHEIAQKRQQLKREQDHKQVRHITLDEISRRIAEGGVKELPIIVKGDVDGSVEALADSMMKLSNQEVAVRVIHRAVGAITESDVLLANASGAIIVGFHVRPNLNARKLAETQNVDIRLYHVIYDAINEVKSALEGMLSPVVTEETTGTLEVRDTFKVPKVGTIAGCYVQDGKITRNDKLRVFRDGVAIYDGVVDSLKRFKDDAKEVLSGFECGVGVENFNDIKVGDVLEPYRLVETKKTLEEARQE